MRYSRIVPAMILGVLVLVAVINWVSHRTTQAPLPTSFYAVVPITEDLTITGIEIRGTDGVFRPHPIVPFRATAGQNVCVEYRGREPVAFLCAAEDGP